MIIAGYKKTVIVVILLTGPFIASFTTQTTSRPPERRVQKNVVRQMIAFRDHVEHTLLEEVSKTDADPQRVRQAFLRSRLLFKKFEWAASYFAADLAERLNGPPVQEIENADLLDSTWVRAIDPVGLQVIAPFLYPEYTISEKEKLIAEVRHLMVNTDYLIAYFAGHPLATWRILDAAKLEVFRIIALGITGFDNALTLNSMEESAVSLESLRDVLSLYAQRTLLQQVDDAIEYLRDHPDFDSFDRAEFITRFANKISRGVARLEGELPGPKIRYNRMLRQEAATLFDPGAFNADAFSPGPEFHISDAKVALGKKLFYDTRLSGTGTRSCASCHNPDLSFTDGKAKPTDIHNSAELLGRNTPTLLNAALQSNYFYDMRALTLEDQVMDVIHNRQEMDTSIDSIVAWVSADRSYGDLFKQAFPREAESKITADEVTNAIASYVRSLTTLNSRFDAYMRGREDALTRQELNGFNLFTGKAKCATCHFIPLFNGVTPPKYVRSEAEVLGVPVSPADSTLDPDRGYYNVIGVDSYKNAFKIPTVRNITKTAPYMHNGAYSTLDEVMEFYNNAGAKGLGIPLPNQTLPEEKLNLTDTEKADIIAFMKSLDRSQSIPPSTQDTTQILQTVIDYPALQDSLLKSFKDQQMTILKSELIPVEYDLLWNGQKVRYVKSASASTSPDLSVPPGLVIDFPDFRIEGDISQVVYRFKNVGLVAKFELKKSANGSWKVVGFETWHI